MKDENKKEKYEKPELAHLGDEKGELSEKNLRDVTGGTVGAAPSSCTPGGSATDTCRSGSSAVVTCVQGGSATATCSSGALQQ